MWLIPVAILLAFGVSWLGGSTSVQNIWDLDAERSIPAHDVAHRVALSAIWQLPIGREHIWGSNWNRVLDTGWADGA
jgi:hypothetical protein